MRQVSPFPMRKLCWLGDCVKGTSRTYTHVPLLQKVDYAPPCYSGSLEVQVTLLRLLCPGMHIGTSKCCQKLLDGAVG